MQNTLPEVGKTYISRADPDIKIYVESVTEIDADEENDAGFAVEGCDPKHIGKQWADGIEIMSDDWHDLDFTPLSQP